MAKKATKNDRKTVKGNGGETHQTAGGDVPTLTTKQGVPVADDQNTLTVGERGPAALEDFHFREKLFHFDHERIPERVVHARGFAAHGYFENYAPLDKLTRAGLFQKKGQRTPAFVRFSTVAGNKGSGDLARDVRGFAVKLYTEEGNWDIVGNNIPVFFIQDAMKFPDLIHAAKQEPDRGFPQAQTAHDNFWDFISLTPESMHMVMWIMSDRTIPRSLRFMEGFGVHSFRMVNAKGESTFVKFHWKPKQGMQSVVWNEALKINGADPDFHRRDMWGAIESGDYPEWELGLQIFDEKFAENIVPGIDFTNDPLLQGRNFSYLDTQLKRLGGPNFTHIPINAPKCPYHTLQQDGHMAMENPKGRANYEPNSWGGAEGGPRENPQRGFQSYPAEEAGTKQRLRPESFSDHYSQARQFYISQTEVEQAHIRDALVFELSKVETVAIRARMVAHLRNIDEDLAKGVAKGLRLSPLPRPVDAARPTRDDLKASPALSILLNQPETFSGRKIGVLVSDGADAALLTALEKAAKKEGAKVAYVAASVGGVKTSDGSWLEADEKIDGGPSVVFDAVALVLSEKGARELAAMPPARDFVSDALAHNKFIGFTEEAVDLLGLSGPDGAGAEGLVPLDKATDAGRFLTLCRNLRCWTRA